MKPRIHLETTDIQAIVAGAEAEARAHGWNVTIAVTDDGGHLLALSRLDGAAPISVGIATEKARTSALARRPSKFYEEMVANGRHAALTMPNITHLEGGEPITVDGVCVGAVGVSGVKSAEDAQIARAGIAAWRARAGAAA